MSDFDLDALLAGAVDDYNRQTLPQIRPVGSGQARTTATHRKRVHTAMMSAVALVVIAVPAGVYAATDHNHNGPPVGVTSSQSASPAPSESPSATPSATPSTTPSTAQSSAPPISTDPVPGMYLYRLDTADGTTTNDILYRAAGGDWNTVATVKVPASQPPAGPPPVVMAPDRRHIAWYLDGKLQVSALDGSQVTTLATDIGSASACIKPTWTNDSHHLLFELPVAGGGETIYAINVDGTGRHVVGTYSNGHPCVVSSIDGNTVYAGYDKKVITFKGGAPSTIAAQWPAGNVPSTVVAVSPTSTRLLVSIATDSSSCGCSPPMRYVLLDPATGKVTLLDNANDKQGSAPMSGAFTADGRAVLIADRNRGDGSPPVPFLTVFNPDGTIAGSVDLPSTEYGYLVGLDS